MNENRDSSILPYNHPAQRYNHIFLSAFNHKSILMELQSSDISLQSDGMPLRILIQDITIHLWEIDSGDTSWNPYLIRYN